ncbi:MAG: hypothetical protein ACOYN0_06635 [Phycisphaerales bacterium]
MIALLAAALACTLHTEPLSEPPASRPWPVHIVDGDSHPAGQPPMVVVGSLFTGGHCYREDDCGRVHLAPPGELVRPARLVANKHSPAMGEYLLGNLKPRRGCNEEETCVFFRSPPLDGYDEFTIDSVEQVGQTFTVLVSHWASKPAQHWGPGPHHEAQMLRLGWLPAGEYTLKVICRGMRTEQAGERPGLFELVERSRGEVAFSVAKGDAWQYHNWDEPVTPAQIGKLAKEPIAANEDRQSSQLLYYARRIAPVGERPPGASLALTAPLDWRKYGQKDETLWSDAKGDSPADATLVARIIADDEHLLGKYDWAEISAIRWNGAEVTIHANVWRKSYIYGNEKVRSRPEFAVPLETRHLTGGPEAWLTGVKVNLVWHEGIDNPRDAVEEVRH